MSGNDCPGGMFGLDETRNCNEECSLVVKSQSGYLPQKRILLPGNDGEGGHLWLSGLVLLSRLLKEEYPIQCALFIEKHAAHLI